MNKEIRRAEEAERLMSEPLLVEAFDKVESAILAGLRRVDVGAVTAHRDLIVTLQLLDKLKSHIRGVIDTGKMARLDAEQKSWTDRFKRKA